MKIFWSWQSDRESKLHHYFVRDALKDACRLIAIAPDYAEAVRPEVDYDTKNVAGTPDITTTILDKIAAANVFVADVTPIAVTDPAILQPNTTPAKRAQPKHIQNPNVMSELGYAERALTQSRIILVANAAHYPGPVALPFDWRHRSGAKTFNLPDGVTDAEIKAERKRFAEVLRTCIKPILALQQPNLPLPPITWQPASDTSLALWKGADQGLEYQNASLGMPKQRVDLRPAPRIYARVAPTYWQAPSRVELEQRIGDVGLNIRGLDGDWGLNSAGALSVWGRVSPSTNQMNVFNVTQWFQDNGELWAVNSRSFSEEAGRVTFSYQVPFTGLDAFLRKAVVATRAMGGGGPVGIRLGVSGIEDTYWPAAFGSGVSQALQDSVVVSDTSEQWTDKERRELLRKFWNSLADAYGQPGAKTVEEFERDAGIPLMQMQMKR